MTSLPAIETLLPHGRGMILIDRLTHCKGDLTRAEIAVRRDGRFADGGGVPGWVGLEYMAQTIAAAEGLTRLRAGKPVQVGLLLGCRAYRCATPRFALGWILECEARLLLRGGDGVTVSSCELRSGGRVLAQAEIKAYQPDDIEPFLATLTMEAA